MLKKIFLFAKQAVTPTTLLFSAVFLVLGIFIGIQLAPPALPIMSEYRHLGRVSLINPLLDHTNNQAPSPAYQAITNETERLIAQLISADSVQAVSMYYQDLETGEWFGVNDEERYVPASLMKVSLLVAYLKFSETEPQVLNETIVNDGRYTSQANVPPAQRLALNREYTIAELLERMIADSNNEAQFLLSDYLEQRIPQNIRERLVYESTLLIPASYERGEGFDLTVRDYASIFRILYNATYLNESLSEQALALLSKSSYDSGIVNGLPPDIITANKFGFKNDAEIAETMQFHDCGIIYAEPSPYILCIMTKTNDPVRAQMAVSEISKLVYERIIASRD